MPVKIPHIAYVILFLWSCSVGYDRVIAGILFSGCPATVELHRIRALRMGIESVQLEQYAELAQEVGTLPYRAPKRTRPFLI